MMYISFLVRIWRERKADLLHRPVIWQYEIVHIQNDTHWSMASLDDLIRFFQRQVDDLDRQDP